MTRTDTPVSRPEPTGPVSGQVRIVGAEPAGESTAELPLVSRHEDADVGEGEDGPDTSGIPDSLQPLPLSEAGFDQPSVRLTDEPGQAEASDAVRPVTPGQTAVPSGTATELPHWTEPPTGQVPAVLARDTGDEGAGPGIAGPSWREEESDWVAHDELFEPGVLGEDEVAIGSLDETDRTDVERRPWEFDLDRSDESSSIVDPITEPVDVVTPTGDAHGEGRAEGVGPPAEVSGTTAPAGAAAAGAAAAGAAVRPDRGPGAPAPDEAAASLFPDDGSSIDEELFAADKALPTGSARMGKARRSGLLPSRLRAKRPDDVDELAEAPLAAEPPGASVTDVPGAGRKRRGLAGLAAADRTADREGGAHTDEVAAGVAVSDVARADDVGPGVQTRSPRRSLRRASEDRSPAVADRAPAEDRAGARVPTGGGPPPARVRRPGDRDPDRPKGQGRPGTSPVGVRVGTGLAVAVVALLAFKFGTVPSLVLVVIVVTFAAGECFGVLRRAGYHPATLLGLVGTISLTVGAYTKGVAALPLVLVLITAFTLVWYLFGIERGSPVAGTAATLLTVGWVSLMGSFAGLLLSPSTFPDRHGIAFLLGAIIATVANDVGALVVGGWMGRTPLAPSISPNKTWEGLLGGAVFTILVSTVGVGAIHPWSASNAALLGVVVAVVAPIGDLCESLLKRDLRLKDMGTLLPGHGGVLDRVDALLFVLPATYYLVRALNIA